MIALPAAVEPVKLTLPISDGAHYPIGLGQDHAQTVVCGGHHIAALLVGEFREEADLLRRHRNIDLHHLAHRPSGGDSLQTGKGFSLLLDEVRPAV
jgi:hypothetical protein